MPKAPYSVIKESYLLKATFFFDRLKSNGYFDLFLQVQTLSNAEGTKLDWSERKSWSISDSAWKLLADSGIDPMLVFIHPKVLQLNPTYLKYYRSVAMIPQKGLKAISGVSNIERIENGNVRPGSIKSSTMERLVSSINEVLSLVISLESDMNENKIQGMMYATAGTNIDGSWRNSVGAEGERVIRSIIIRELFAQNEVSSIADKLGKIEIISANKRDFLEGIDDIRTINLINGYTILFTSEPDITLYDKSGAIVGVVEIKAGLDPAAALERLGAMLKSFENTLAEYPNAVTILLHHV